MPEKKTKRQLNAGIYISGGSIEQSDWDTADPRTRMQDYTDMRNGDCIANTTVDILSYPLQNAKFLVKPSILNQAKEPSPLAKEAAEYCAWIYDNLEIGLDNYVRHKLLALHYGLSLFERVWSRGESYNGKITNRLIDLSPIQPDTIWRFKYDEKAILLGIEFYNRIPEHGEKLLTIDKEYLHLFTPFGEFGNPWGRSMLIAARQLYKIKSQIWKASARASSRGAGLPEFIITPSGNATEDLALKTTLQNIARNIGNSENAYVISQKDRVEFKLNGLQNQEMNIPLIQQANREMFYNTMSEFATTGIGENGSRAATSEHKGPFYEAMDTIKKKFECSEYDNIEKIIEQSPYYGQLDESEYPTIVLERSKDTDLTMVLAALNQLTKTPEDEIYIRNVLGLPEISVEELEDIKEENKPDMIPNDKMPMEEPNGVQSEDTQKTEEVFEDAKEEKAEEDNELTMLASDGEGTWITINGVHVLIDDDEYLYSESTKYKSSDEFIKNIAIDRAIKNQIDKNNEKIKTHEDNISKIRDKAPKIEGNLTRKKNSNGIKKASDFTNENKIIYDSETESILKYKKLNDKFKSDEGRKLFGELFDKNPKDMEKFVDRNKLKEIFDKAKNKKLSSCPHCLSVEPKIDTVIVEDIFELKNATETLATTKDKASEIIDDVIRKAIEDVGMKLSQNKNKAPALAYKRELQDRLESVYNNSFEKGAIDVRKEYAKLSRTELAVTPIKITGSKGKLEAKVTTLYDALENSIKDELELLNQQNIDNAGGISQYITGRFSDTQKAIKTQLSAIASGGYIAGRSNELSDLMVKDGELRLKYETSLEKMENLCEVCAPYSNMTFNQDQAEYVGLNWEGDPVNPLCMGGNNCRCTWVPTYEKRE